MMKSRNKKTKDYPRQYDHMSYSGLIRKIDKLQGIYGLPPPFIETSTVDLVSPEFASIWNHVFAFNNNLSEISSKYVTPIKKPLQSCGNLTKPKYKHSSVILESRPLKIRFNKSCKQQAITHIKQKYEPMTDGELCKALSMDEFELAEAFGYSDNTVVTVFNDDTYEVDTDGLLLADDEDIKLAAAYGYNDGKDRNTSSDDDFTLAAAFGYRDDMDNCGGEHPNTEVVRQESCRSSTSASLDDQELAAEFGYSAEDCDDDTGTDTGTDNDSSEGSTSETYEDDSETTSETSDPSTDVESSEEEDFSSSS